jgi:ribonuclease BN (tRNA processing enzyme)
MQVKFYGTRGSFAVPGKDTVEFGGNTTCVSFQALYNGKICRFIIDSGTGIIQLGRDIIQNFFAKREDLDIHIGFTHLHPDHTQGFPFFAPNFFKNCNLSLYGMQTLKQHIGDVLAAQMSPPIFPLEYHNLKSVRNHFEVTSESEFLIHGVLKVNCMQAFAPSHPQQGAIYYKVTDMIDGTVAVCVWDNESKIGGDKAVINFAKNADIMIHDTQYTSEEYDSDKMIVQGFGHSTYEMAIENATKANVPLLYCIHYSPNHTDYHLDNLQTKYNNECKSVRVILAKENEQFLISKETV